MEKRITSSSLVYRCNYQDLCLYHCSMKDIVIRYKKLIYIWIAVNLLALMINSFNIYGEVGNNYLLSHPGYGSEGFWPFVKIIEQYNGFERYGHHNNDNTYLNGLFYRYDITEFMFYMVLLIAFLSYKAFMVKEHPTKS